MSGLIHFFPEVLSRDFLLPVAAEVAIVSSTAWLVSRRLAHDAALRHLVLFSALICCLAIPVVTGVCAAAGLTLVSIPILNGEQSPMPSAVAEVEFDQQGMQPRLQSDPLPVAAEQPLPLTNVAVDKSAHVAAHSAANQSRTAPVPSEPNAQRGIGQSETRVSFRGLATSAIGAWTAGALLMLVHLAWNCGRVVMLRRSSRPAPSGQLRNLLEEVAVQLGVQPPALLVVSNRTISPLAIGFWRPAIVLPECLLGVAGDGELRNILVHEMAHLVRGDQRILLLQEFAGALYWPIVSIHWLNRELQRAREELCDNVVLAGRDAISYGETLLHVAELLMQALPVKTAVGIIGGPGELERRIAGLIDPRRNSSTTTSRRAAFATWLTCIAGSVLLSTTQFADSGQPAGAGGQETPPTQLRPAISSSDDEQADGHFSGRVTGPDGKPVRGARIFILPLSNALDGELTPQSRADGLKIRAETDADGHFEFDAPDMVIPDLDGLGRLRWCVVTATADGYGPDWREITGRTRSTRIRTPVNATDVALQLATDDVPIQGRFLDSDGRPLAGARVQLIQLMIPQKHDLNSYIQYVSQQDSGFMNGPAYERTLFRLGPLPGTMVETQTDADGRFTLSGYGRERLAELKVTAPSVVDTKVTVMTRDAPEFGTYLLDGKPSQVTYGAKFTLQLKRGITVTGLVRDRATQLPIPGMWVGWRHDPLQGLWTGEYSRTTDAQGRFTITGLDPQLLEWTKSYREVMTVSAPGLPYQAAVAEIKANSELLIECSRGIPFRLKLLDEQGRPVMADVTYREVQPNRHLSSIHSVHDGRWPVSRAAHRGDGIYEGFVLPGPGAVLVQTRDRSLYRPAHVDPKAFFAPGRTNWTAQERISAYGTNDTLSCSQTWINQHDYAAIVLVNSPRDSKPLELSATLIKDKPRRVSLVDVDGKPVVGAKTAGLTFHPHDDEPPLRSDTLLLTGLNRDHPQRITLIEEKRQLIGELMARGDAETPYIVVMKPWGTVTGQILDENGKPMKASLMLNNHSPLETNADPDVGEYANIQIDANGRFRIDRLVPGQRYTARVYGKIGMFAGTGFENLVVRPAEVRDLGDIRTQPPVNVRGQ